MEYPTWSEKAASAVNYLLLTLLALCCLLPFIYVLSVSFTSMGEVAQRGIVLIPRHVTLAAYRELLVGNQIINAYKITIFVTVVGTLLNLIFTLTTAYPLARKQLPGRNIFLLYILFTMLFSGGMIPQFLLVKSLGLLDTVWALIVPGLVSGFLLLVMKGFIEQLPEEIFESARIDGAGEMKLLFSILLPLSMPIIATLGLFYAVGHWNSFFDGLMYINDPNKYPLQVVLRFILLGATDVTSEFIPEAEDKVNPLSIQMAAVIVTTLPIMLVYPFIQKHFTKGVLLGSVKG
ncbi:ABC transporter permease [Paenibacillus swuensis]|uniref:ABC transporter permease n=1 Tax=Paenibacillus swuensis TaxID=1178515 RepID=A0A172TET5_9BACL|nr:carbohydrate ABC transporter permease [Paenibacillus swuensis]ANE45520.1 ABC transporter permease [Paenibacillus swuensis]